MAESQFILIIFTFENRLNLADRYREVDKHLVGVDFGNVVQANLFRVCLKAMPVVIPAIKIASLITITNAIIVDSDGKMNNWKC